MNGARYAWNENNRSRLKYQVQITGWCRENEYRQSNYPNIKSSTKQAPSGYIAKCKWKL